jgi:outer membrane protein OmpA-like peptidoglycan-associated protein
MTARTGLDGPATRSKRLPMKPLSTTLFAAGALAAGAAPAGADGWVIAEAPAAVALSDTPSGELRAGVMPALGVYADTGVLALGVRARVGVLRGGSASGSGAQGVGTGGVAVRLAGRGPWIEGVAGAGVAGHGVVPALEAGLGWEFRLGAVDLGPSARYVHLSDPGQMATPAGADLLLLGIDVRFGAHPWRRVASQDAEAPAPRGAFVPPAIQPFAVAATPPVVERAAPFEAPVAAPPARVPLEEHVLFARERAEITEARRAEVRQIMERWTQHPEWLRMTIEGHADVRGGDAYNLELSWRRAASVRDLMIELGAAPATVDVVGFGRSRPLDPATTEAAHQRNRRVEFVVDVAP